MRFLHFRIAISNRRRRKIKIYRGNLDLPGLTRAETEVLYSPAVHEVLDALKGIWQTFAPLKKNIISSNPLNNRRLNWK